MITEEDSGLLDLDNLQYLVPCKGIKRNGMSQDPLTFDDGAEREQGIEESITREDAFLLYKYRCCWVNGPDTRYGPQFLTDELNMQKQYIRDGTRSFEYYMTENLKFFRGLWEQAIEMEDKLFSCTIQYCG